MPQPELICVSRRAEVCREAKTPEKYCRHCKWAAEYIMVHGPSTIRSMFNDDRIRRIGGRGFGTQIKAHGHFEAVEKVKETSNIVWGLPKREEAAV